MRLVEGMAETVGQMVVKARKNPAGRYEVNL